MKLSSLIVLIFVGLAGCGSNDVVTHRKFPYPYKAVLAICSDIDGTDTIEKFLEI